MEKDSKLNPYPLSRVFAVEVVRSSEDSQFLMVRVPQTGQLLCVTDNARELFEAVSI